MNKNKSTDKDDRDLSPRDCLLRIKNLITAPYFPREVKLRRERIHDLAVLGIQAHEKVWFLHQGEYTRCWTEHQRDYNQFSTVETSKFTTFTEVAKVLDIECIDWRDEDMTPVPPPSSK